MVPGYHGPERRHPEESVMDKARNVFGVVRDVVGIAGIVLIPLVALAWRAQESRVEEAKAEAAAARRELVDFKGWHADTMVRRDYLDARFAQVEAQITALRDELRAERGNR